MADPTTLPAVDFPDVIREGCALVLVYGIAARCNTVAIGPAYHNAGVLWARTAHGVELAANVVIDLTRPSGQWAVAMWAHDLPADVIECIPAHDQRMLQSALRGEADPAELRRVALEVRGG